ESMDDWIFQGNPRHYDLDASVAASREQWWGTPRYRDRMAVGDRVWLQVVGPKDPGIYYVATIVSETYEHPVQPSDPAHFRWRTDIRFESRIRPPLLRSELLEDVQLGSFRPFRGFQGSNVPVPPDGAAGRGPGPLEPHRASSPCYRGTGEPPSQADSTFSMQLRGLLARGQPGALPQAGDAVCSAAWSICGTGCSTWSARQRPFPASPASCRISPIQMCIGAQ